MNACDKSPDYKGLYEVVKRLYAGTMFSHGPFDETYYSLRVFETAKTILRRCKKKCNRQVVLVACLVHDVGKTKLDEKNLLTKKKRKEWGRHPELSVPIARRILKRFGHSTGFIDEVCWIVGNHDKCELRSKPVELQVMQDADLIADCGIAGFIRPFLYGSEHGRPVVDSIRYIKTLKPRVGRISNLNLAVSKKLAKGKVAVERDLIRKVLKDIDTELLKP